MSSRRGCRVTAPVNLITGDGHRRRRDARRLSLRPGTEVYVFDTEAAGRAGGAPGAARRPARTTYITDAISWAWDRISAPFSTGAGKPGRPTEEQVRALVGPGAARTGCRLRRGPGRAPIFLVAAPVARGADPVGVVALASVSGEIDHLVRLERERVLQMFLIATLVSVGLSLILASTIANPLAELAAAAEVGSAREPAAGQQGGRIRIPDLTARPDEIGRLSGALRGMVGALYHRIESNEQFAADVAHEIKNPLASLRSAVGTMRVAKREDQRSKLLDVIEHDVRRLDRLVSDISNASRLDGELVKEEQEPST